MLALSKEPVCAYLDPECELFIYYEERQKIEELKTGEHLTFRCVNRDHLAVIYRLGGKYVSYGKGLTELDVRIETLKWFTIKIMPGSHYFLSSAGEVITLPGIDMIEYVAGENLQDKQYQAINERQETIDSLASEHIEIGEAGSLKVECIWKDRSIESVLDWLEELGIKALDPESGKSWREIVWG